MYVTTVFPLEDPRRMFTRQGSIVTPVLWTAQGIGVRSSFNGCVITTRDGDSIMLVRVEDLEGISWLWVVRRLSSTPEWVIDPQPLIGPGPIGSDSHFGAEDPRITYLVALQAYVIVYTAYGPQGPRIAMAQTRDFRTIDRQWRPKFPIDREDKNATLLDYQITGADGVLEFVLMHRPLTGTKEAPQRHIWVSRSPDLVNWGEPVEVMGTRGAAFFDSVRIGTGPSPMLVPCPGGGPDVLLMFFHAVRGMSAGVVYTCSAALLDQQDPSKVLRRSPYALVAPEADYERFGDVPNVVFPTGVEYDEVTGILTIYCGTGDCAMASYTVDRSELVRWLWALPDEQSVLADPLMQRRNHGVLTAAAA